MTPAAARASLAAALHDQLGPQAALSAAEIVDRLAADGWDIRPATPATTQKETTSHGR